MRTVCLLLCVAALVGCRAARWTRAEPWGTVTGPGEAEVARVAAAVEEGRDVVRSFPGYREGLLQVEMVPLGDLPDGLLARTSGRTVRVAEGVPAARLRRVVTHELMHAHLGESYRELPRAVKEGLAELATGIHTGREIVDAVYVSVVVEPRAMNLTSLVDSASPGELPSVVECLTATDAEYFRAPRAVGNTIYAVGRIVAREIGAPGLLALCEEARREGLARVPAERLLAAAGLSATDPTRWIEIVGELEVRVVMPPPSNEVFKATPMR